MYRLIAFKNMKKVVSLLLTAVLTASVCVQNSYGQGFSNATFGVRAGVNFTKFGGSDADIFADDLDEYGLDMKTSFKPGIQLGVVVNFPMKNEKLTFQTGLIYSQQGAKWKASGTVTYLTVPIKCEADVRMNLNYFQIPLNFLYRHDLNSDLSLLLQAGPYICYGINGKLKSKVKVSAAGVTESESDEENLKFGSEDELNNFDLGLGLGVGVLFREKIHVGLGYNLGFANISSDVNIKNKGFALTITYMFNK